MGKHKSKHEEKTAEATDKRKSKLSNNEYEAKLFKLHAELVKLQYWVQEKGLRIIVVFEGRDAAGKGGVITRTPATTCSQPPIPTMPRGTSCRPMTRSAPG